MKRLLWLLLVPMMAQAQPRTQVVPRAPEVLIQRATAVETETNELYYAAGAPSRVTAKAIAGTSWSGVTVTVYGINDPGECGADGCLAADGSSLGTITTDGGILDINTGGTVYTYTFALVTIHGSGTVRAELTPLNTGSGGGGGGGEVTDAYDENACSNADVDSLETVCEIQIAGYDSCTYTMTVATADLTEFEVSLRNDDSVDYLTIYNSTAHYNAPDGWYLMHTSGDLTVASTSGTHGFRMANLSGWHDIRVQAAGTSSAVTGAMQCQ